MLDAILLLPSFLSTRTISAARPNRHSAQNGISGSSNWLVHVCLPTLQLLPLKTKHHQTRFPQSSKTPYCHSGRLTSYERHVSMDTRPAHLGCRTLLNTPRMFAEMRKWSQVKCCSKYRHRQIHIYFTVSSALSPEVGLGHVVTLWTQTRIKHATFPAIIGVRWKCNYQKKTPHVPGNCRFTGGHSSLKCVRLQPWLIFPPF